MLVWCVLLYRLENNDSAGLIFITFLMHFVCLGVWFPDKEGSKCSDFQGLTPNQHKKSLLWLTCLLYAITLKCLPWNIAAFTPTRAVAKEPLETLLDPECLSWKIDSDSCSHFADMDILYHLRVTVHVGFRDFWLNFTTDFPSIRRTVDKENEN